MPSILSFPEIYLQEPECRSGPPTGILLILPSVAFRQWPDSRLGRNLRVMGSPSR